MKFTRTARDSAQPQDMQAATQSRNKRSRVVAIGAAVAIAAGVLCAAAPAHAIRFPHVNVHVSSAYHFADSYGQVQHYNKLENGEYKKAKWAPPGNWSKQEGCWVGVKTWYYNFES